MRAHGEGADGASSNTATREPQPGWEGWEQAPSMRLHPMLVGCAMRVSCQGVKPVRAASVGSASASCGSPVPPCRLAPLTWPLPTRLPVGFLLLLLEPRITFQVMASPVIPCPSCKALPACMLGLLDREGAGRCIKVIAVVRDPVLGYLSTCVTNLGMCYLFLPPGLWEAEVGQCCDRAPTVSLGLPPVSCPLFLCVLTPHQQAELVGKWRGLRKKTPN